MVLTKYALHFFKRIRRDADDTGVRFIESFESTDDGVDAGAAVVMTDRIFVENITKVGILPRDPSLDRWEFGLEVRGGGRHGSYQCAAHDEITMKRWVYSLRAAVIAARDPNLPRFRPSPYNGKVLYFHLLHTLL